MAIVVDSPSNCPECGEAADRHIELIPVERRIVGRSAGTLTIQGLISEKRYEEPERPQLVCPNGHLFSIPAGLDLRYV